jgi:16S rRNA (guanine966-N2)-methyltransferase
MTGLRVIAGKARGRRLRSVPGDSTRPITDRAKESLFNILAPDLPETSWLDLFAGTGCVGIEALSRGADFVCFVDINRQAVETVHANLEVTGFDKNAKVLRMDSFSLLDRLPERNFDFVFIAPPQYKGTWKRALFKLDERPGWLAEAAWVIVQIHPVEYEQVTLQHLTEFEQRRYGSTLFVFYEKQSDNINKTG